MSTADETSIILNGVSADMEAARAAILCAHEEFEEAMEMLKRAIKHLDAAIIKKQAAHTAFMLTKRATQGTTLTDEV